MRSNFHTHTKRCGHAFGVERDYVLSAIDSRLDALGFSEHAPFPDKDYGLRMIFGELQDYIDEIARLSEEFKDKIILKKGLEIEYHPQYNEYYRQLLNEYGLDYLALGQHMYTLDSGEINNIFFAKSTKDYIIYAESVADAFRTGCFAFCAHPDIMFINEYAWDKNCERACDIILNAAEELSVPLEFNANGIRRGTKQYPDGIRCPYPHEGFWKNLSGSKQPVIIGADAHSPEQIYDDSVLAAYELAGKWNLNVITNIF